MGCATIGISDVGLQFAAGYIHPNEQTSLTNKLSIGRQLRRGKWGLSRLPRGGLSDKCTSQGMLGVN